MTRKLKDDQEWPDWGQGREDDARQEEARWAEGIEELKFRMECGSKETG